MAAQACLRLRLLSEDDNIGSYEDDQSLEQEWITWRFRETRRRTGLFVWVSRSFLCESWSVLILRIVNELLLCSGF